MILGGALICIFSLIPTPAWAEPCEGETVVTIGNHEEFSFCWDPNPEPDIKHYTLHVDGELVEAIPLSMCTAERCDSPMYLERQKGTYIYTVRAVDTEDFPSDDSNPVTVTVINIAPGNPTGFGKNE